MNTVDTIAAICTGTGGAIAIIRISGTGATAAANAVWTGKSVLDRSQARRMLLGQARLSRGGTDTVLAVYLPGPTSYTGEDIVEIHCHGGNLICRQILEAVLQHGVRQAEPGEFTYRAFINGKMDLTQAEAVADLIGAGSDMALHLAERQLAGTVGEKVDAMRDRLLDLLGECESRLDFAEEELDWLSPDSMNAQLDELGEELRRLLATSHEGIILRQGIRIVIAGRPNAGKSSLLNRLLGFDRAIVTAIPGTTRDTLEEATHIRGIPVRLIDTAGIRDAENLVEGMGIDRSKQSLKGAQLVLWLLDAAQTDLDDEIAELIEHLRPGTRAVAVWNKIDLAPNLDLPELPWPTVKTSVLRNQGLEELLDAIEKAVWEYPHEAEPEVAVSARHAEHLRQALDALPESMAKISREEWELAAVHLREALAALGRITGETVDPDVLDNIFSRFCIGK